MKLSNPGILLAVFIGLLPFVTWAGLLDAPTTTKSLFVVLVTDILVMVGAYSLFRSKYAFFTVKRPLLLSFALLGLIQVTAALVGVFPAHSFLGDSARSTGVLFMLHIIGLAIVLGESMRADDWPLVRRTISLSAGFFALLTIIGVGGVGYDGTILWFNFSVRGITFGNETFAGIYLVIAALIAVIELVRTRSVKWRIALSASLGAIAFSPILLNPSIFLGRSFLVDVYANPLSILGFTRASSAIFFAAGLFFMGWWALTKIPYPNFKKYIKIAWASLFIGATVLGSILLMTPGSIVQETLITERTTVQRFIVWEAVLPAVGDRPWLGWGQANFDRAFESHFDPRLYQVNDRLEVWFDRAHNAVLGTLISVGGVGVFVYILLIGAYVRTMYRAWSQKVLTESEFMLWLALPFVHLIQLQTAFNVVPAYALLGVVGGYALWLESTLAEGKEPISSLAKKIIPIVLVITAAASFIFIFFYELPRQMSLVQSLSSGDVIEREELIRHALSRPSDFEGLHRTGNLFVESVFDSLEETTVSNRVLMYARPYLGQYIEAYESYLVIEPEHYRARMNYAYLLLLMGQWGGEDRTDEVLNIIQDSYALSPNNPTTYVLHAMTHAYRGDFKAAHTTLDELDALVPGIKFTTDARAWVTKQEQIYPAHSFLIISNI